MKFIKLASVFTLLLSCAIAKADIVENTTDTARVETSLPGDDLADLSTGGIVVNRHGGSTTPVPPPESIPEPASALLLGVSLIGAAMISRRRKGLQI